jgi:hypothetical protein
MKMARLLKLFLLHLFFFLGASVGQQEEELLYYLGDPQIGFGNSGWQEDVQRFSSPLARIIGSGC